MSGRIYNDRLTMTLRIRRVLWGVAYHLLFRATPRFLFHGWRIFLLKLFGARIGVGCKVAPGTIIWAPWNLEMKDYVCLADDVDMYNVAKVFIGSNVTISQRAFVCTASHDISYLAKPLIHREITINNYAWVCSEAFLSPGVTIGVGSVVAARAVVTKDVDEWTVVAGNPAKVVKKRVITVDGL